MPKSVHVDIASSPEGAEVEVPGLGVFANGSTTEISDERLTEYKNSGYVFPDEDTYEFVIPPVDFDKTESPAAAVKIDTGTNESTEALKEQLKVQEERKNDPLATATIGIDVPSNTEEDK